jgi:hypothetical protein
MTADATTFASTVWFTLLFGGGMVGGVILLALVVDRWLK